MNYSNLCNAGRCVGLIHPEHTHTAAGVCVGASLGFCITDIARPIFINLRSFHLGHRKAKP